MRQMAQRQIEERVNGTEKEIMGLKEMILEMKKSMDRLTDEMRESHNCKRIEESETSDGSIMKLKGKVDDTEMTMEPNMGNTDRSKYKKVEMSMFTGLNP